MQDFRWVDPRDLILPSSRQQGADPGKYQRQVSKYGRSSAGMPPLEVREASDGAGAV